MDREAGRREVGIKVSAVWRKSSRSNNGGNGSCVEVALNGSKGSIRDTKNRTGFVIQSGNW
ncbi:MAG: hypothetical protein QOF58_4834, partial [Pseudonocardiales bacterium]|nr:hypothetical protein [Pseudonocardiales bacterium]